MTILTKYRKHCLTMSSREAILFADKFGAGERWGENPSAPDPFARQMPVLKRWRANPL